MHLEAVSAARFRAHDGRIHSVSVLCDVTARQEAWARLQESEARYRVIVDASRNAVIEVDRRGRTTFQTGVMRELFGLPPDDSSTLSWFNLLHPEDRPRVEKQLREAFASGETVELRPFRMRRQRRPLDLVRVHRASPTSARTASAASSAWRATSASGAGKRKSGARSRSACSRCSGSRASACSRAGSRTTSTTC